MAEEATAVAAPAAAAIDAGTTAVPATAASAATTTPPAAAIDAGTTAVPVVTESSTQTAKPAEPVTPEKYDFVAPKDTVLDPTVSTEFASIAKELNISQADAQKVIDKMAPMLAKTETARDAQRIAAVVERASAEWGNQARADKEFGGDSFDANLAFAKQTFATFGTPELEAVLKASGLDSHPELIRWAYRVGKQLAPDGKVVTGGSNTNPQQGSFEERAAAKLYAKS